MMRIKLRFTNSTTPPTILTLPPPTESTISDLLSAIKEKGNIKGGVEIKYGFPPKVLDLSSDNDNGGMKKLSELGVKLEGEQLMITEIEIGEGDGAISRKRKSPSPPPPPSTQRQSRGGKTHVGEFKKQALGLGSSGSGSGFGSVSTLPFDTSSSSNPDPTNKDDPPDVPLGPRGTVVLRVMEDDNSCMFRAISYVATNSLYSVEELRQLVASTIQSDPILYSEGVLGQKRDEYCSWITMESSWGGGIELSILAGFFDMEIVSIDVSTGSVIRFNEGRPNRCFVVYSGIHYDALALSPLSELYEYGGSRVSSPEVDVRIFSKNDEEILEAARVLVAKLRERKYFTDTNNFTLKCGDCGVGLKGQKAAVIHAKKTGHANFGEYS